MILLANRQKIGFWYNDIVRKIIFSFVMLDKNDLKSIGELMDKQSKTLTQLMDEKIDEVLVVVNKFAQSVDSRFDLVDDRFNKIETKLDRIEVDLADIRDRLAGLEKRISSLEVIFDGLNAEAKINKENLEVFSKELDFLKEKMAKLELKIKKCKTA